MRAALGVNGDAHLLQHAKIPVEGADRDTQPVGQIGGFLVGLPLEQHDQGDQAGGGCGHHTLSCLS